MTDSPVRVLLVVLFAFATLLGACAPPPTVSPTSTPVPTPVPVDTPLPPEGTAPPPTATAVPATETAAPPAPAATSTPSASTELVFASFDKPVVNAEPVLHHEEIAPDLSNVYNPFLLSQAQLERLSNDGFVVSQGSEKEFFTLYEQARYTNVPIFITTMPPAMLAR